MSTVDKSGSSVTPTLARWKLDGATQHFAAWLLLAGGSLAVGHDSVVATAKLAFGIALAASALATGSALLGGMTRVFARSVYVAIAVPLLAALGLHGLYVSQRGTIGEEELRAVAQTHLSEAASYIGSLLDWTHVAVATISVVMLASTYPSRRHPLTPRAFTWAAVLLALVVAKPLVESAGREYFGPMYQYVMRYRAETDKFQALLKKRRIQPIVGATSAFTGTLVVVIGESTTRRHMGLYGYHRDTTPRLSAMRSELLVFNDVIAPHSHTVPALMSALTSTGASDEQQFFEPDSIDIVTLAKAAGIETHWLSNQNEYGIWDNPVTLIGKNADHARFFSTTLGMSFRRTRHDEHMLPAIRDLISRPSTGGRLIFVHLFATHWPYCENHPGAFAEFKEPLGQTFVGNFPEQGRVNCYDDGIRYVDWFLAEVINDAAAAGPPTAVVYFSDHGEAPLLGTGHESSTHSSYHIEIPMIVAANQRFRSRHAAAWNQASEHEHAPYSTSMLFHSLTDLMEIRHASVQLTGSLFNGALTTVQREALNGTIHYDRWSETNDYRENSRAALNQINDLRGRVWAHRVNSVGTLLEAKETFSGVEMDVVFEDDCRCFRVYHSPAPDTGLTLETMLDAAESRPDLRFWFDWKNASRSNVGAAMEVLDRLDQRYGTRDRVLVETASDATFPGIDLVSTAGFKHGYYLPTEEILEALTQNNTQQLSILAERIERTIAAGSFDAITFDWRLQPFVRSWLAATVRRHELSKYIWDLDLNLPQNEDVPAEIRKRFDEDDVAALLVVFPSVFKI